jgi:putative phosphoribosyl transferase
MQFADRRHAGVMLGEALVGLHPEDPLVMALPRGGVPVGYEVAVALGCPLEILLVRKVGVPGQPELAMGALAEGGVVIRNQGIIDLAGVSESEFDRALGKAEEELAERARSMRGAGEPIDPSGHTVLVVDDGLATGATALAGIRAIRQRGARAVWLCVPVAPSDTVAAMEEEADRVVVLQVPERFTAVGYWYARFDQTSDTEVGDLLARSRLR